MYIHIYQVFQTNPNTLFAFYKGGLFQLNYIFHYISVKKMLTKRKKIAILLSLRRRRYITAMINHLTRPKIRRRWWVHPILKNRKQSGCFTLLFDDLLKDENKFKEYFRYVCSHSIQ